MTIVAKTSFICDIGGKIYLIRQGRKETLPDNAWESLKFTDVFNRGLILGATMPNAVPKDPQEQEVKEGENLEPAKPQAAPRAKPAKAAV